MSQSLRYVTPKTVSKHSTTDKQVVKSIRSQDAAAQLVNDVRADAETAELSRRLCLKRLSLSNLRNIGSG
jgi:hypothetical protein